MKRTALIPLFILAFFITALYSCLPQKKISDNKKELAKLDSQLVKHSEDLKILDARRQQKEEQNEIDSAANSRIKKFIDNTNTEIDTLVRQNTLIINGTVVNREDWDRLRNVLARTRSAEQRINQKISLLEDLINRNMVVKLEQDILFEPGSYSVTPSVIRNMTMIFEPAVAEIDRFTKKYPDFPLSLVITFKGYADGTQIDESSSLYRNLKARLNLSGREPDNKELNKELSRARAEAVWNLFKEFAASKSDNGIYIQNVLYLYEGKGEIMPDPKVSDYRQNDPRRRVVLLFWSIFPD
jgi:BMFP domain-containing protein YqiC